MTGRARAVVVGEALVDVVPDRNGHPQDLPGGSPANVAITLGRLGRDVQLVTLLGDDARGAAVRAWLGASGVTVLAQSTASGRTSTAAVTLDTTGAASYVFDLDWNLVAVPGWNSHAPPRATSSAICQEAGSWPGFATQ